MQTWAVIAFLVVPCVLAVVALVADALRHWYMEAVRQQELNLRLRRQLYRQTESTYEWREVAEIFGEAIAERGREVG